MDPRQRREMERQRAFDRAVYERLSGHLDRAVEELAEEGHVRILPNGNITAVRKLEVSDRDSWSIAVLAMCERFDLITLVERITQGRMVGVKVRLTDRGSRLADAMRAVDEQFASNADEYGDCAALLAVMELPQEHLPAEIVALVTAEGVPLPRVNGDDAWLPITSSADAALLSGE